METNEEDRSGGNANIGYPRCAAHTLAYNGNTYNSNTINGNANDNGGKESENGI